MDIESLIYSIFGGAGLLASSFKRHKQLREIENQPTSKVVSAPQGYVELQGFAWPKTNIITHWQQQELLFYSLAIEKKVTSGSGKNRRTHWEPVYYSKKEVPTLLLDATGAVEIKSEFFAQDPNLNQSGNFFAKILTIARQSHFFRPAIEQASPGKTRMWGALSVEEQNYLLKNIVTGQIRDFPPTKGLLGIFSSAFRITEKYVPIGAPIYIKGNYSSDGPPDFIPCTQGLYDFCRMVFDQRRSIKDLRHLLDKNQNGKISTEELLEGYPRLATQVRKLVNQAPPPADPPKIYGAVEPNAEHGLVIYFSHQEQILKTLKKKVYMHLGAGLILLTYGLSTLVGKQVAQAWEDFKTPAIKRAIASKPITQEMPAAAPPQTRKALHQECVNNSLSSCMSLLQITSIPEANKVYYRKQACQLGDKRFCL